MSRYPASLSFLDLTVYAMLSACSDGAIKPFGEHTVRLSDRLEQLLVLSPESLQGLVALKLLQHLYQSCGLSHESDILAAA